MAGELGIDAAATGIGGAMAPSIGGALEGGLGAAAISTPDINIGGNLGPEVANAFGGVQNLGPDVGPMVTDLSSSLEVDPKAGIQELAGTDVAGAENLGDLSLPGETPPEGQAAQAPLPDIILNEPNIPEAGSQAGQPSPDNLGPAAEPGSVAPEAQAPTPENDQAAQPDIATTETTPLKTAAEIAASGEPPALENTTEQPMEPTPAEAAVQDTGAAVAPQPEAQTAALPPVYDVASPAVATSEDQVTAAPIPGGPLEQRPITIDGVDYDPNNPPKAYQNADGTIEYRGGVPLVKDTTTEGQSPVTPPEAPAVVPAKPDAAAEAAVPVPAEGEITPSPAQATEATDTERAAKMQALQEKIDNHTATAQEIKELRDLKQDPEQHRLSLEQKAKDGTITDEEADELGKLNAKPEDQKLTPEQQAEKLNKDLEDMGVNLMEKLAKGEELTPEEIKQFQDLYLENNMVRAGASPDAAREAVQKVFGTKGGNERQTHAAKEVQGKIQELMALQLQLKTIPEAVKKMRVQRNTLISTVRAKHNEAEGASGDRRIALKRDEYQQMSQLAGLNDRLVGTKRMGLQIFKRSTDLEVEVRRKTGVTGGLGAVMEWADSKAAGLIVDLYVETADEIDYMLGRF